LHGHPLDCESGGGGNYGRARKSERYNSVHLLLF
jgi:hypothetical protein